MLAVSQVVEVKQLAGRGVPIREISRQLSISRNTVRRYLRGAAPGAYRLAAPRPRPVGERILPRVREWLKAERQSRTPRKQRLTASRIHRLLVGEGFDVSERTVRTVVREVRMDLRDALERAFLPLEYDPGKDAQVDFMEGEVDDEYEGRVKRHVLIVRACYSRRAYRYAAPNQTREAVFEGLIRAFEFFGGVFEHVWFDNLSPAVKKVLKGRDRELHKAFEAFQAHYGFRAEFCRPGRGNEKGGVETDVKWTRSEVFSPLPHVAGRADLQRHLDDLAIHDLDRIPRGRDLSIGAAWQHEQDELLPLPPHRFDAATTRIVPVSKHAWVQVGTNFYSVPVELVGRQVTLKLHAEEVAILGPTGEVARHRRSDGRDHMVLELEHYLPLIERKHRGLDRAVPVRQWMAKAPACWTELLRVLRVRLGEVDGSKAFIEALKLCSHHGAATTSRAVEKALSSPWVSLGVIRYHVGIQREEQRPELPPLEYRGPSVQHGSAAAYMEVLGG